MSEPLGWIELPSAIWVKSLSRLIISRLPVFLKKSQGVLFSEKETGDDSVFLK